MLVHKLSFCEFQGLEDFSFTFEALLQFSLEISASFTPGVLRYVEDEILFSLL
jgi:hypothetical protein